MCIFKKRPQVRSRTPEERIDELMIATNGMVRNYRNSGVWFMDWKATTEGLESEIKKFLEDFYPANNRLMSEFYVLWEYKDLVGDEEDEKIRKVFLNDLGRQIKFLREREKEIKNYRKLMVPKRSNTFKNIFWRFLIPVGVGVSTYFIVGVVSKL